MKEPLLSTEEKRRWLARVFRDTDGEYSQADKFKALVEDTKLAALQQEEEEFKRQREAGAAPQDPILTLLQSLPPAELDLNRQPPAENKQQNPKKSSPDQTSLESFSFLGRVTHSLRMIVISEGWKGVNLG